MISVAAGMPPKDVLATKHKARRRILAVCATALGSLAFSVTPSWAVGNASLNAMIVPDPVPQLSALPTSFLRQLERLEVRALSAVGHEKVIAADNGWRGTNSGLTIILIGLQHRLRGQSGHLEVRAAVSSACGSALASATRTRSTIRSYRAIPGAQLDYCSGVVAGKRVNVTAASWLRSNVIALVIAVNLPRRTVRSVSFEQSRAIPATGVPVP